MQERLRYPAGVARFLRTDSMSQPFVFVGLSLPRLPQSRGPGVLQEPPRDTRLV